MSDARIINLHDRSVRSASEGTQRGRVVHDPRGNAVWDWAVETGVLAKATTEQLLSTLGDPISLSLEPEPAAKGGSWSGDPYNRS